MSVGDFFKAIVKNARLTAFLTALSIILCSLGIELTRNYTASVIIKYIGNNADQGLSENGKKINPYEISSATVVKNAVTQLGFENVNTENIRRNITVTPIEPTAEKEKYASWIENFANYEDTEEDKKNPVYYSVTYTSKSSADAAKNMLSAIINQYRIFYVKNYTYNSSMPKLRGSSIILYDYYETAEFYREKINSNVKYIQGIVDGDFNYRSQKYGYSLEDLIEMYNSIEATKMSSTEGLIFKSGATKDNIRLIDGLNANVKDKEKAISLAMQNAETQKTMMQVYSEKNSQYLWDEENDGGSNDDDAQSNQVRENADSYHGSTIATYDIIMNDYVKYRTEAEDLKVQKTNIEKAIGYFDINKKASDEDVKKIEERLSELTYELTELYNLSKSIIDEYNEYKSARNIATISGVIVNDTVNTIFYYGVSVIMAVSMGIVLSIAIEMLPKAKRKYIDE